MKTSQPRVALICDYALSYLGGAQTALVQQAAALAVAGARVLIISPSPADVWDGIDCPGVEHLSVPARVTLPGLELPVVVNSRRTRRLLRTDLEQRRISTVHLHSEFGLAAAATAVAAELRLPVLHTVHTFFWQTPLRPQRLIGTLVRGFHTLMTHRRPSRIRLADQPADSALRNMTLTIARQADWVISPSAHQGDRLRAAGLARVAVIPNTVTVDHRLPNRSLTAAGPPLTVLWIGRCEPEKRILPFVRAVRIAIEQLGPDRLRCVVVGEGSQLEAARRLADQTPEISFLGRQDHRRIPSLLAESHLLALTSYGFDNQPMTVVESVMALRGVLYCDPALTEGLDGPGIPTTADPEPMAATLVDLATAPDRVLRASAAAVTAREEFAPATHAQRVLDLYQAAGRMR